MKVKQFKELLANLPEDINIEFYNKENEVFLCLKSIEEVVNENNGKITQINIIFYE